MFQCVRLSQISHRCSQMFPGCSQNSFMMSSGCSHRILRILVGFVGLVGLDGLVGLVGLVGLAKEFNEFQVSEGLTIMV